MDKIIKVICLKNYIDGFGIKYKAGDILKNSPGGLLSMEIDGERIHFFKEISLSEERQIKLNKIK